MGKAMINTPFESCEGVVAKTPSIKGVNGTYSGNRPPFDKPHSKGKDTIPVKFFSGEGDKIGPLSPDPEAFQSPHGNTLTIGGAVDRKSRKSGD